MTKTLPKIIADNVKSLMKYHNLTQPLIAKTTSISQKTISNVLNPGKVGSITTDTIEKLADFFNLEPYHLMIPDLPVDELLTRRIELVIEFYAKSQPDSRENIRRIAENEMRYCNTNS